MRLLGALVLLVLAGCGQRPIVDPAAPSDLLPGRTFLSEKITVDGKPQTLVAGTRISLAFTEDGRLVATAGCNTMTGQVRPNGGRLNVGDGLAITEMGCDPQRQAQDEWLADFLDAKPALRLEVPTLTLRTADTELVLTDREVAEPDLPLAETNWVLDTLLDGQTASSVPAGATASLAFAVDEVRVDGGCNRGTAGYTMSGDTIGFGQANMTRKACAPAIMRLENAVLDVIRDKVTVELDGDRLTLTHPSGKGLQLHAE
jgi:heat shock protein HslJ